MLRSDEALKQMCKPNSVCWYGHVLRREDYHILGALELEAQRMKETCEDLKKAGDGRVRESLV